MQFVPGILISSEVLSCESSGHDPRLYEDLPQRDLRHEVCETCPGMGTGSFFILSTNQEARLCTIRVHFQLALSKNLHGFFHLAREIIWV